MRNSGSTNRVATVGFSPLRVRSARNRLDCIGDNEGERTAEQGKRVASDPFRRATDRTHLIFAHGLLYPDVTLKESRAAFSGSVMPSIQSRNRSPGLVGYSHTGWSSRSRITPISKPVPSICSSLLVLTYQVSDGRICRRRHQRGGHPVSGNISHQNANPLLLDTDEFA